MYEVALSLSREARQFFEGADAGMQRRLDRCFDSLKVDPYHHPNIKRLKGDWSGANRYRVGDYRVIYRVDTAAKLVKILIIANRREVYE